MDIKRYENLLKTAFRNTVNEIKRLNASKEEKFKLIIEAYNHRDTNLLKNTITDLGMLVTEQKKIYSRLKRGVKNWYKLMKAKSKVLSRWYHFFEYWFSDAAYFLKLFEVYFILPVNDIDSQLEEQVMLFDEISKNPLEEFFKYKVELNNLYKQELENYDTMIEFIKSQDIDACYNGLNRLLSKCKERLNKVTLPELQILNNKIESILFLLVCVDLLRSIEVDENWLEEIYQQVTEIEELLDERGSSFNSANLIIHMNAMQAIIRR